MERVMSMKPLAVDEKSAFVQSLVVTCPLGVAVSSCPATALRNLPLNKRMSIVRRMTPSELDTIIATHRQCLKLRRQPGREIQGKFAMSA
jgi:hypothetical protein